MKIAKKAVNASVDANTTVTATENVSGKYDECIDYIRSAISSLGPAAKDDVMAREAIANLSVILFDLQ